MFSWRPPQTSPLHSRDVLEKGLRELSTVDGVLECRASHAWSAVPGELVGTVHVRVRQDADEMLVLTRSHQALGKWIGRLTVQIERDAPVDWLLQR